MSQSDLLLSLVEAFPQVFADPEAQPSLAVPAVPRASQSNQYLLQWIEQFPAVFADPDAPVEVVTSDGSSPVAASEISAAPEVSTSLDALVPTGYNTALQRTVSTFTWGQIDCYLTYGSAGLERLWITVGKSGTEVQSLCEAICRLVNLLLSQQVELSTILKELRGIRGADAEGLGPQRVLGLADLIGKVLQDAPQHGFVLANSAAQPLTGAPPVSIDIPGVAATALPATAPASAQQAAEPALEWSEILTEHQASLCPECGAELQQMNGCSGGACQVCGYSSCS